MGTKVNLIVDQGATFSMTIDLLDNDGTDLVVTGYTAAGKIKKHYLSANSTDFTTALANGELTISLTATQTANLAMGKHVYDVELTNASNTITRVMEGLLTVLPEVTK